jgi:hypothetical protein
VERILSALRAGSTRKAAAGYGQVGENTLGDWLRRSRDFRDQMHLAEAEAFVGAEAGLYASVRGGNMRAIMFWLERRHPEDWGRREQVDVQGGIIVTYTSR